MMKVTCLDSNHLNEWDRFVERHPHGTIYHLSGWKQALEKTFKHIRGKVHVVRDHRQNNIIAGVSVYTVKSFFTGNRLVGIPLAWQGAPLVSNQKQMKILGQCLLDQCKRERVSYLEMRLSESCEPMTIQGFGVSNDYQNDYLLLDCEPEKLKKRFHKKGIRKPLSKSLENGLILEYGKNEGDLTRFYGIFKKSRKHLGLPLIPYDFFKNLWHAFQPSNQMAVLIAVYNGKDVGSSLLLKFKQHVFAEYGADLVAYRKLYINHFLDWESIKLAYNEGYKIFHFGRTALNNIGLRTFKKRWGTQSEILPTYYFPENTRQRDNPGKTSLKYRIARSVLKKSPTPVFQMFSHFISHHMG